MSKESISKIYLILEKIEYPMVEYKILYSKFALKDAKKLSSANLSQKAKDLIEIIKANPFQKFRHKSFTQTKIV